MNTSLKKLIGKSVYRDMDDEPWGKVKGVCFSEEESRISSVVIESLSLVPLSTTISIKEIWSDDNKKLILKSESVIGKGRNSLTDSQISKAVYKNGGYGKIKDMRFDFETGEITDIVIAAGVLRKGEKVSVNKTYIKDNTIYIE